MNTFFTKFTNV